MASGLEKEWGKLKLNGEEEEVLEVDDSSSSHLDFHIALCLVGKLLTKNSFNAEALKHSVQCLETFKWFDCQGSQYQSLCLPVLFRN